MHFHWRDVRDSAAGLHLQEEMEWPQVVQDFGQLVAIGPLHADVHASLQGDTCFVQGTILADITYRCSRCLTEFADKLNVPLEEEFVQATSVHAENEDEQIVVAGEEVDLDPWIRQAVMLSLPYRPLCRLDCAGLCPVCGGNRNLSPCHCDENRVDPRWAELAKFFEQQ